MLVDANRVAFRHALAEYNELGRLLRELSRKLPELPGGEIAEGEYAEVGYTRIEDWTRDGERFNDDGEPTLFGPVHVYSNGWSSISDEGEACWLQVDGLEYRVPEVMEWD